MKRKRGSQVAARFRFIGCAVRTHIIPINLNPYNSGITLLSKFRHLSHNHPQNSS